MRPVVVVGPPRAPTEHVDRLAAFGVATVHEAMGRRGYLGPRLRPVWAGARTAGTAVTVSVPPGDNLMVHVAVEQTGPGDILVIAPTSPSSDGYVGELFAVSLAQRGVRGLVTDTGVRDVAALRDMRFAVWSSSISAQGTVKTTAGSVNVPIVIGGVIIRPGDVVLCDDDGVVVVAREGAEAAISASAERVEREGKALDAFRAGSVSLDVNRLRPMVEQLDIRYVSHGGASVRADVFSP